MWSISATFILFTFSEISEESPSLNNLYTVSFSRSADLSLSTLFIAQPLWQLQFPSPVALLSVRIPSTIATHFRAVESPTKASTMSASAEFITGTVFAAIMVVIGLGAIWMVRWQTYFLLRHQRMYMNQSYALWT